MIAITPKKLEAVFRCEVGPGHGYGHFVRCAAVAEELIKLGWLCRFAMSEVSASQKIVRCSGFDVDVLQDHELKSAKALSRRVAKTGPVEWVIVDHYGLDEDYERALRSSALHVGCFEDLESRRHAVDLMIGMTPDSKVDGTQYLEGTAYVALRRGFLDQRALNQNRHEDTPRIVIGFGAIDGCALSLRTLPVVLETFPDAMVDILIGEASPSREQLIQETEGCPRTALHVDHAAPESILSGALFAIGAGGVSALERCALGVPSVIAVVSQNQWRNVWEIVDYGAAISVEADDGYEAYLASALNQLTDSDLRLRMAERASSYCDGKGAARIADAMIKFVT